MYQNIPIIKNYLEIRKNEVTNSKLNETVAKALSFIPSNWIKARFKIMVDITF